MPKGIAASPGIMVGNVFLLEPGPFAVAKRLIKKEKVASEVLRFEKSLAVTKQQLLEAKTKVKDKLGEAESRIFDAYELILEDKLLRDNTIEKIKKERVNAEYGLTQTLANLSRTFESISDEYLKERGHDITQVGEKVIKNLQGVDKESFFRSQKEVIVVAHGLTPSDTVSFRDQNVVGFVTDLGSKTSHTAITATAMEVPSVVGLKDITRRVKTGDRVIIDGYDGWVIINPQEVIVHYYLEKRRKILARERALQELKDLPAITLDGRRIEISANIGIPEELSGIDRYGAEGIGLLRTECLFINRPTAPSEEEQFEEYSKIAQKMFPASVIIRTLDMGADKFPEYMDGKLTEERNPFLGLRGIRFCLAHPEFFIPQLKAILRASARKNAKIMYPMVCNVDEIIKANHILEAAKTELKREKKEFDPEIPVGVTIEVPSAALSCDLIARYVDFLSIGTNDLIQYTMAVDRINTNVAYLYNPLHVSVLNLIARVVGAGHKYGKWVGLCGEMAADPTLTKILLGLGIDEFSMEPGAIPRIKKIIRSTSFEEVKTVVKEILATESQSMVKKLIKKLSG